MEYPQDKKNIWPTSSTRGKFKEITRVSRIHSLEIRVWKVSYHLRHLFLIQMSNVLLGCEGGETSGFVCHLGDSRYYWQLAEACLSLSLRIGEKSCSSPYHYMYIYCVGWKITSLWYHEVSRKDSCWSNIVNRLPTEHICFSASPQKDSPPPPFFPPFFLPLNNQIFFSYEDISTPATCRDRIFLQAHYIVSQ